jgi:small subunit ribosomal protein S1
METHIPEKQNLHIDPRQFKGDERADLVRMYEETLKDFTEGSIVPGRIIDIRPDELIVDIGYKSEGAIPKQEFRQRNELSVGDEVEVLIDCLEDEKTGVVCLSHKKAELQRNWDRVLETCAEGGSIQGCIKSRVKGGMVVDVGVDAFLPGSQLDVIPVRNPEDYMGRDLEFKILKINKERRNIVLSRRELLEDMRRDQKKELMEEIQPGQIRKGVVKNITDFGAFIDLTGMDGLLHITDMSWGRIDHPSRMVSVGQPLEVMVLDVDREKDRISLGLKQKSRNPWDDIDHKYPVGSRIRGRVVNLVPYGAFVEIEEGVEGLVHVSELSWTKRIAKASDVLEEGQEVDVMVLNINRDEQKISLGIRQTESNPWDHAQEKYPIGSRVSGTVRNFTSYGAFVELEAGIDGMVHVSDMSWTRKVNHPSEVLTKGDAVECVVLEVDPVSQRISLGMKQALDDPWTTIGSRYRVGQLVTGKVSKIASFGAFVEMEEGIDGLVHISQISDDKVEKVRDVLQPGQDVQARVVRIDPVERKIGLSIKAAQIADEEFEVDDAMLEGLRPGDDLVDLAGAFDEAFGGGRQEEWHPGDKS